MTKPTLEYVFSGCGMMKLQPNSQSGSAETQLITRKIVTKGIQRIKNKCNNMLVDHFSVNVSCLYNAYIEKDWGEHFHTNDKFGFDNVYADSGGLQVVTRGMKISDDLKKEVYKKQEPANFSMCFDEIPVTTSMSGVHRAGIEGKMFMVKNIEACATKTATNVKEQIEALKHVKDNKVMYIIQGNSVQDMIKWADYSFVHFNTKNIGGLAMANTCMGFGTKETLDVIKSYKHIVEKYTINNQIHLLGVGSLERMKPVLNLMKSGYIDNKTIVSFDSSSCSMSLMMGRLINTNGKNIVVKKDSTFENHVNNFVNFFHDIFLEHYPTLTKEQVIDSIVANSSSLTELYNSHNLNKAVLPLLIAYNLVGFFQSVKDYMDNKDTTPIGLLRNVRTHSDMEDFERNFGYMLNSQRVFRVEHTAMEDCWV